MAIKIAVVYEADADLHIAIELADRVLVESIQWLEEEHLDSQRQWLVQAGNGQPLMWSRIGRLARESRIRSHGHFAGQPALPDAVAARRAILFLKREFPDLKAIILVRDQDGEAERRQGLNQARDEHPSFPIVIGLAVAERECWVICGFNPLNKDEEDRLEKERQKLGYDPRLHSHLLTACKNDNAVHSAKRVVRALCGDDHGRQQQCWRNTPLTDLDSRGQDNGLSDYLNEIRTHLAPKFGYVAPV